MGVYERQQREKKILEAAIKIFAEKGPHYTRIEEVAAQAKMSKGLTYFYFKSKEDLYMAVVKKAFEDFRDMFNKILTKGKDQNGFDNVISLVDHFLEFSVEKRFFYESILHLLGLVNLYNDPATRKLIHPSILESPYFHKLLGMQHDIPAIGIKIISKGIRDNSIRPELHPETTFYMVWSMLTGFERLKGSVEYEPKDLKIHAEVWKNSFVKVLIEILKGPQYAPKQAAVQGRLF
ncbi:TetR/AcrR family transcriptional regulator [Lunatimonas salinarum]|uniref:TetR/AcrR family transcriptional regulator n=1 Tax=Lunatimonas salinarum TaxID=1774590 RepID=UPI001ADF9336|nr:TetR/AcrR family transcriptional regulator [Lunatimonas salinarum]